MDIVESLRADAGHNEMNEQAAHEIERLRLENEILRSAMQCANVAMAGAPIWHTQHRIVSEVLVSLQKALVEAEQAEAEYVETHPLRAA